MYTFMKGFMHACLHQPQTLKTTNTSFRIKLLLNQKNEEKNRYRKIGKKLTQKNAPSCRRNLDFSGKGNIDTWHLTKQINKRI